MKGKRQVGGNEGNDDRRKRLHRKGRTEIMMKENEGRQRTKENEETCLKKDESWTEKKEKDVERKGTKKKGLKESG